MSVQKIIVFINGNTFFSGKNILYDSQKYKSLKEFFLDLASLLPRDANLAEGIRRLFTPRGRHVVRSLEELKCGNIYVCAGAEPFRNVDYKFRRSIQQISNAVPVRLPATSLHTESITQRELPLTSRTKMALSTRPHPLRQSHPPVGSNTRALHAGSQAAARFLPVINSDRPDLTQTAVFLGDPDRRTFLSDSNHRVVDTLRLLPPDGRTAGSRQIFVVRPNWNGYGLSSLKVIITRSAVRTLGQVMCEISEAFGPRWSHDPIRHIYTITGREVRSVIELFRQQKLFIATGMQRLFGPGHVPGWNSLSREAATNTRGNNEKEIPFTGVQIREMLGEFWPDHPDPAGVVIQWDKRLMRIRQLRASIQESSPKVESHLPTTKGNNGNKRRNVECVSDELQVAELAVPKSRSSDKTAAAVTRVEERDSGFDESILNESKPPSQTSSSAARLEPANGDQTQTNNHQADAVNVDKQSEHEQVSKPRLDNSKPFIRRSTPSWKCIPHPSGMRLSQVDSPSCQSVICGSQIKKAADEKDTIGLCLWNGVNESNVRLSEEPSQVRIPFVGLHQRAIFMHPTNKWLSPFKTGSVLPALQGVGTHQLKEAGNQEPEKPLKPTETGCKLPSVYACSVSSNSDQPKASSPSDSRKPCFVQSILPVRLESITEPEEIRQSEKLDNQSRIGLVRQVQLAEQTEKRVPANYGPLNARDRVETGLPAIRSSQILVNKSNAFVKPKQIPDHMKMQKLAITEADEPPKENSVEKGHLVETKESTSPSNVQPPTSQMTLTARRRLLMDSLNIPMVSDAAFLDKRYHIGRTLGDGNFAVVRLARRRDTGQQYAIKMIDKTKLNGKESMLFNEVTIMHRCNHPNIVRLYEEFETPKEIWLSMEYVKDGDLFDGITKAMKFSEATASGIVRDLAGALFYLHCRSIVHRDLKPENVLLYRQPDGRIRVKLADFGLALEVRRDLHTICGTPTYIAPEILNERGYGLEVDMWALGVITYIMLCGFAPFRSADRSQSKLFEAIRRGVFVYLSPYWDPISQSAKDLINRLLVVSPKRRLTAQETLLHPWVFGEGLVNHSGDHHPSAPSEQRRLAYQIELEKQANLAAIEIRNTPSSGRLVKVEKTEKLSTQNFLPLIDPVKSTKLMNPYAASGIHFPTLPRFR